jgi:hypothetical protein
MNVKLMTDLGYLGLILLFFLVSALYGRFCGKL